MTAEDKSELLSALFLMVLQHCDNKKKKGITVYKSGELQAHKLALEVLVKHGKISAEQVK